MPGLKMSFLRLLPKKTSRIEKLNLLCRRHTEVFYVQGASIGDLIKGSEEKLGIRQMEGISGLSKKIDRMKIIKSSQLADGSYITGVDNADWIMLVSPDRQELSQTILNRSYESPPGKVPEITCLVLAQSDHLPSSVVDYSRSRNVFSFATVHDEYLVESRLKGLYNEKIMCRTMIHGTLINWREAGIVLTGESGTGKSTCACRMVADRRAYLVADDAVILEKRDNLIYGRPHELTKGLMEIKGRGLVDAGAFFGNDRVAGCSRVDLIVRFKGPVDSCTESRCILIDTELPVIEIGVHSNDFIIDKSIENAVHRYAVRGACNA